MPSYSPVLSVILPVYNAEDYVADAIHSIRRQDNPRLEVIVVDDGSTDRSAEIVRAFPEVTYVFQKNRGPAAARNHGLDRARGDLIAFLDADDWWAADKLALQCAYLAEHPSVEVIQGLTQFMRQTAGSNDHVTLERLGEPFAFPNLGSALFRASAFDTVGPFDSSLDFSEDVDWFIRARNCGVERGLVQRLVHYYRVHDSNMTVATGLDELDVTQVLKNMLDRRRQTDTATAGASPTPSSPSSSETEK